MTLKAILFDYGGTLDADGINWQDRFYPLYQSCGVNADRDAFRQAFHKADDNIDFRYGPESEDFKKAVHHQVKDVLWNLELPEDPRGKTIADKFLEDTQRNINRNIPLLKTLKKSYKLGIISNYYGNLNATCRDLGLSDLMDVLIDSTQIKALKPNPKIFFAALEILQIKPQEALYIGDSLKRDMAGAKKTGMWHIWLTNGRTDTHYPCCPGDITLKTLRDLPQAIQNMGVAM